jgi:hypothetical protein
MFLVIVSVALAATAAICAMWAAGLTRKQCEHKSMASFAATTTALARISKDVRVNENVFVLDDFRNARPPASGRRAVR